MKLRSWMVARRSLPTRRPRRGRPILGQSETRLLRAASNLNEFSANDLALVKQNERIKMILKDVSQSDWENPSPGIHQAVCIDWIDLGLQETEYGEKHRVQLLFQLDANKTDGSPMRIGRKFNATIAEKSSLRASLKSWRGADLTAEEREHFDLEQLIGAQAQVNIEEFAKTGGGTGTAIGAILPPADGQEIVPDEHYIRRKDKKEEESEEAPF